MSMQSVGGGCRQRGLYIYIRIIIYYYAVIECVTMGIIYFTYKISIVPVVRVNEDG